MAHMSRCFCCACSAATPTPFLGDKCDDVATTMNVPVRGNVLDNATVPAGTRASISGFTVEGSNKVLTPSSSPVALTDLDSGSAVGTLVLESYGGYVFMPAPDYVGPVPAINLYLASTNGQTAASSLTIDVLPRKWRWECVGMLAWGGEHA